MSRLAPVFFALAALVCSAAPSAAAARSANGRIVFASGRACPVGTDLWSMRPDGTGLRQLTKDCFDSQPVWSADGSKLAFVTTQDGDPEIATMQADGSGVIGLTPTGAPGLDPSWSPDGSKLAFTEVDDTGARSIYVIDADGGNLTRVLTSGPGDPSWAPIVGTPAWSPDGTRIAFAAYSGVPFTYDIDIYTASPDGTDVRRLAAGVNPAWSPDGARIAFTDEYGGSLWLMNADGGDQHQLATPPGGTYAPVWSPDGTQLAYTGSVTGGADPTWQQELYAMPSGGGVPWRLTTNPSFDGQATWQPLTGGVLLAGGMLSIPVDEVMRLGLGAVTVSPAHACGTRPLHVSVRVRDEDGYAVRGDLVTVRGLTARTTMPGVAKVTVKPSRHLRRGRLRIAVSAGPGAARTISVPVRCRS